MKCLRIGVLSACRNKQSLGNSADSSERVVGQSKEIVLCTLDAEHHLVHSADRKPFRGLPQLPVVNRPEEALTHGV